MPNLNITLRIPPAVPADGGGECTPSGPYLSQSIAEFPASGQMLHIFAIYGLSPTDEVFWETDLGPDDYALGPGDRHTLPVVYVSGPGGTVTAIVNGEPLGTAEYLPV